MFVEENQDRKNIYIFNPVFYTRNFRLNKLPLISFSLFSLIIQKKFDWKPNFLKKRLSETMRKISGIIEIWWEFPCSNSVIETTEQGVKSAQS